MTVFLTYILLGVSLAAPVGPVNAAQLNRGIKKGFFHAWVFGIGALSADILYMLLVFLGVSQLIENSFVQVFLWLFGFFVLMYTGVEGLKGAGEIHIDNRKDAGDSLFGSFSSGFIMSISNPLTVMFWLGIFGSVLAKTASASSVQDLIGYSAAIILGILLWDFAMALASSFARRFLHSKLLILISILSSVSMIGFGVYFGWHAMIVLFF
ncbi:LysE family transporter [Metabacillus sp. JX24]|uniref:LysE family transporter n=1 Tax=Metabacillus sp. JX24 TaxID=3240759 RepID=UPI00351001DC